MRRRALALVVTWLALVGAGPLPLAPPPPDLTRLVPFVTAPLAKPPVTLPRLSLPDPPVALPNVPPVPLSVPSVEKPIAPLSAPGTAPCLWSWLPSASERLKCGLGRFYHGEYPKARDAL